MKTRKVNGVDMQVLAALRTALGKAHSTLGDAWDLAADQSVARVTRPDPSDEFFDELEAAQRKVEALLVDLEKRWPL